tara:strand:- start:24392 stop:24562 length:171 start_codon:yes stop_codon:yes gene_type:complete
MSRRTAPCSLGIERRQEQVEVPLAGEFQLVAQPEQMVVQREQNLFGPATVADSDRR